MKTKLLLILPLLFVLVGCEIDTTEENALLVKCETTIKVMGYELPKYHSRTPSLMNNTIPSVTSKLAACEAALEVYRSQ